LHNNRIFQLVLRESLNWTNLVVGAVIATVIGFIPRTILKWINKDIERVKEDD